MWLTEVTEALVQFPPNFFHFISHGVRGEGIDEGRASGGVLILLRSKIFDGTQCKIRGKTCSYLAVDVKTRHRLTFCVVGVYRCGSSNSPVYDANFFQSLETVCAEARNDGLPVLVAGDFNAKIGSVEGAFAGVDEFVDFLPLASESEEVDDAGAEMLSMFGELDFYRLPFAVGGREQLTFARLDEDGSISGSVIDHVFFSEDLLSRASETQLRWEFQSPHLILGWPLRVEGCQVDLTDAKDGGRESLVLDLAKVMDLSHTPDLVRLATSAEEFTPHLAYSTVVDFISTYTRKVTSHSRKAAYSKELRELMTTIRRVRRLWARDKFSERGKIRGAELSRLARLCRERRDLERKQDMEELRKRFWEAHYSGQAYKAWQLARSKLPGKGGGIKTSVTQGISREDWEAHFSNLLGRQDRGTGQELLEIQLTGSRIPSLDEAFSEEEVRAALDGKKNHKAPGPDNIRIDFLRILRYDDTVCRALANLFTIIMQSCETPQEWRRAYLFILYKGKGDRTLADSFRGITLKSHMLKLFETLLERRLYRWMETRQLLPREQLAYRRGKSGVDHIFVLNVIRECEVSRTGKLYVALIDLRKAFPSVSRRKLVTELVNAGVSDRMVGILRKLYVGDTFQLLLDGHVGSLVFVVVTGVHEGSCLSPLLFIFFIRDLTRSVSEAGGMDAPAVGTVTISTLVYADDVAEMARTTQGLQREIDATVDFFSSKELDVNPDKSDLICFTRARAEQIIFSCNFRGVTRQSTNTVRYLGIFFDSRGSWKSQKDIVTARSRSALGRCKTIVHTIGKNDTKHLLNLFDSIVSSVYRYAFGAWGPVAGKLDKLDGLFVQYVTWLFTLPRNSCRTAILACFGRRCAFCDSLFLASVQLAKGFNNGDELWGTVARGLRDRAITGSKWYGKVTEGLEERNLWQEVWERPHEFISERRDFGVKFSQFCFHNHLNISRGNSSDDIRDRQPFGIYPFLFRNPPGLARFLFSFILSNWRWLDRGRCSKYPRECTACGKYNGSYHVLFECLFFEEERREFILTTGVPFSFEALIRDDATVAREVAKVAKKIYLRVCTMSPL